MFRQYLFDEDTFSETMKIAKLNKKNIRKRMMNPIVIETIVNEALQDWIKKNRKEYVDGI